MMNCNKNMKLCPLMQHKWAISSHFQRITQPHNQFSSYSMNPTVPLIFLHSALDLSSSAMKQNTKQSIQLHSVGITESLCLLQSCIFYFFALPSSQLFCQDMWVWHQNKQHGNIFLKKRKGKNIRILGTNMSRVWDSTTSASSSFQSSVMFGKDHWCYYIYIYTYIWQDFQTSSVQNQTQRAKIFLFPDPCTLCTSVEFMYFVFTCMQGESCLRQLRSLLFCL